jgi:hypothetical protein
MARTYFRYFTRDVGETEVHCEYSFDGGSSPSGEFGPPENYDPGCSAEVCVVDCWLASDDDNKDAPRITLTDAEYERFDQEANENPPEDDCQDDMS